MKAGAEAEENTAFDASGSSRLHEDTSQHESLDRARSWNGDIASHTEETDITDFSQSLESLGVQSDDEPSYEGEKTAVGEVYNLEFEHLPVAEKENLLSEMFPNMKAFDIKFAVKKYGNSFDKTVEELLSQVFLMEGSGPNGSLHPIHRGIDAFIDSSPSSSTRRTKGKRRKKTVLARRSSSTPAPFCEKTPGVTPSKWDIATQDVSFIAERTHIPTKTIASTYHKSATSLSSTLFALCASEPISNPHVSPSDPIIEVHACELAQDFPSLPPNILTALIYHTHPSTASAHELAVAMTSTSQASPSVPLLIPQYARVIDSSSSFLSPTKLSASQAPPYAIDHSTASALAASHTVGSQTAFGQASAAYRISRSKPLMSGAAGYYSLVGRDASSSAQKYRSLAADALVSAQSSLSELDLHGVSVKDAVRITREKVEAWWEGGQREWARAGKVMGDGGFRVVTGMGRHSEGGKGKLGPAVGGMLIREGWRVEIGEGVLLVKGRARR